MRWHVCLGIVAGLWMVSHVVALKAEAAEPTTRQLLAAQQQLQIDLKVAMANGQFTQREKARLVARAERTLPERYYVAWRKSIEPLKVSPTGTQESWSLGLMAVDFPRLPNVQFPAFPRRPIAATFLPKSLQARMVEPGRVVYGSNVAVTPQRRRAEPSTIAETPSKSATSPVARTVARPKSTTNSASTLPRG